MKTTTYIIMLAIMVTLFSCEKYEPLQKTVPVTKTTDTSDWHDQYADGGVLPVVTPSINELVGTTWILTEYYFTGMAHHYPNDTIKFITNSLYVTTCGSGSGFGGQRTYSLSNIVGSTNLALILNFYCPFGGSNYSGVVGEFFVSDKVINNAEFSDMQNSSVKIRAFFKKI